MSPRRKKQHVQRGGGKYRLPGLKSVQTKIKVHKQKKLPAVPENPIVPDGEFDWDKPPDTLDVNGVDLWRATVRLLRKVGELDDNDRFALRHMCYLHQRLCKLQRADKDMPKSEHRELNRMLIEYGMTPVARLRVDPHGKLRANGPVQKGFGPVGKSKQKIFEEQNVRSESPDESEELEVESLSRPSLSVVR